MGITFVSAQDTRSFLVPAYQSDWWTAEASAAMGCLGYEHFSVGSSRFQPRDFNDLSTHLLDTDIPSREAGRSQFVALSRPGKTKPADSRNTCLLVEGRRTFYRYVHQTTKFPPYYYRFASGDFPCYAVWGRDAAHPLGRPLIVEDGCSVFVGRSARGVAYACVPKFNSRLAIEGYTSYLALVEFSILDRDPRKDDVLRYTLRDLRSYSDKWDEPLKLDSERYDPLWQELVRRAFEGYLQNCNPEPRGLAEFLEQKRKSEDDFRSSLGASFHGKLEKLDWQDALRLVEEPWQLELVVRQFDGTRFYESPNYSGSRSSRISRMLRLHDCPDERRTQLHRMLSDFVIPRDTLWDYSGD